MTELEFKKRADQVTDTPEIDVSASDIDLVDLIDAKVSEYSRYYDKEKIKERSERNVEYWRGRQKGDDGRRLATSDEYRNNVIHRDLNVRVTNATSRMPDIIVMSPQMAEKDNVRDQVRKLEDWLRIRFDGDVQRRLAKASVMDNHLQFRGIWKYRYDEDRKDAVVERLRPQDVIFDSTARIPEDGFTCDNMEFVGEWIEEATASVLAKFPKKADELKALLTSKVSKDGGKGSWPSKLRYMQCWVTSHKSDGAPEELLVHKYDSVILSKGPNPYWDADEGTGLSMGLERHDPSETLSALSDMTGIPVVLPQSSEKPRKKNHFPFARKPYTVFSGENLGNGPLDDTTVVEVSLSLQDTVNRRGNQIGSINDWAIPKIFVAGSAIAEEKASNITRDPSEVVVVSKNVQDIRAAVMTVSGEPASPALYKDLQDAISQIDAHFAASPIRQLSGESGLSKQISREDDLSRADEIAQTMVQRAVEEAANWLVQLAKIYFDEPHSATSSGPDRSLRSASVSSEMIPDDVQVVVKANAIDKPTLRNLSLNLVGSKAIDPMSLYEDLDYANPKERAHRLIDFLNGPPSGYVKYLQDIGSDPGQPAGAQDESSAGGVPTPGSGGQVPQEMPQVPPGLPIQ